jgi:hypothetical protein
MSSCRDICRRGFDYKLYLACRRPSPNNGDTLGVTSVTIAVENHLLVQRQNVETSQRLLLCSSGVDNVDVGTGCQKICPGVASDGTRNCA